MCNILCSTGKNKFQNIYVGSWDYQYLEKLQAEKSLTNIIEKCQVICF